MFSEILPLSCLHRASPSALDESPTAGLWFGSLGNSPPAPTQTYKYVEYTKAETRQKYLLTSFYSYKSYVQTILSEKQLTPL